MKIILAAVGLALIAAPAAANPPTHAARQCKSEVHDRLGTTGKPVLSWRRDQMLREYPRPHSVLTITYMRGDGCWRVVDKNWTPK
jgi:hypothetical protein